MTGKPVLTIYARGGAYSADAAKGMDFQRSYFELLLGFIGFKNIQAIVVEPTLAAPADVAPPSRPPSKPPWPLPNSSSSGGILHTLPNKQLPTYIQVDTAAGAAVH